MYRYCLVTLWFIFFPSISFAIEGDGTNLNVIFIILSTITTAIAAIAVFFTFYTKREQRQIVKDNLAKDQLLSTNREGFFFWDKNKNSGIFSPVLSRMLGLLAGVQTFEQLLTYFKGEDKEKLRALFEEIKLGKKNKIIQLNVHVRGTNKHIACSGDRIHNTAGMMTGIILWFQDNTDFTEDINILATENAQLKAEVKHYSSILNAAPFPIWKRNKDLFITYCNLAYNRAIEEGNNQHQHTNPMELSDKTHSLASLALEERLTQEERHHIVIKGKRHLFQLTETPVENNSALVGFAQDITELEDAEREISHHKSAQRDLLESSASATAIFGSDTRIKFFNNAYATLWGMDESWLNTNPTYSEILEELRKKRKLPEQINFLKFKQEQIEWFRNLIEPHNDFFYLPDGTALRIIVIPHAMGGLLFTYEDMTDRLAFERSYNTLIAVQRATLDNLHEGIAVFGQNGCLTLSNPVYAHIWNLEKTFLDEKPHIADILDKTKYLYNYGKNWEKFKDKLISDLYNRTASEQRIERSDGSVIDASYVPLPDGATLVTYVDTTDSTLLERSLRERNEALEEADRLKTEFLANVSYELRSPLTSIIGFSEVLNKQYFGELNSRQKEYVGSIHQSSHYLMALINDILDLASFEAGYMSLNISMFDICEALSSILPLIKERVKEHNLTLNFECPSTLGNMLGDERRIKQMVFKLLSNAIKFTPDNGEITLGSREEDNNILIWVQDSGIGIPGDEQLIVFDKFYKTERSKSHSRSGAGLGLSVVKNIIELHGGNIELESKTGQGTIITCSFQRHNASLELSDINENEEDRCNS